MKCQYVKRPSVNVSINSAEVLMAYPFTFTSLAAVLGYSLPLCAVQWRTAEAATLSFAPLFTTHATYATYATRPGSLLFACVCRCIN